MHAARRKVQARFLAYAPPPRPARRLRSFLASGAKVIATGRRSALLDDLAAAHREAAAAGRLVTRPVDVASAQDRAALRDWCVRFGGVGVEVLGNTPHNCLQAALRVQSRSVTGLQVATPNQLRTCTAHSCTLAHWHRSPAARRCPLRRVVVHHPDCNTLLNNAGARRSNSRFAALRALKA